MGKGAEMRERRSAAIDVEGHRNQELDDDGRPRRTGTVWTTSSHIITSVIGSGILSLPWCIAQLGWIAGSIAMLVFALITYYTSSMLADCYRTGDNTTGKRNYTYMDAVGAYLGRTHVWICGLNQYANLWGCAIGYTITAAISAAAVKKATCFHKNGHEADCSESNTFYMLGFGAIQLIFSQLPNLDKLWWLSGIATIMSFAYSLIAIVLSIAQITKGSPARTTLTGTEVGVDVTSAQKMWGTFQAIGDIAFAYSFSMILIEIQDTIRSPPSEKKTMMKATFISVSTTTAFYVLCGCLGYMAFGNNSSGNILTGFGFYEPYWLVNIANVAIVVHLVGTYQVCSQPIYCVVEDWASLKYPNAKFLTQNRPTPFGFSINLFRLIWRTFFVAVSTLLAMLLPFFNDVLAFLGATGFWPLTVYFPIEMYISRRKIKKFSSRWIMLESLSLFCFIISLVSTVGSIQGLIESLQHYTPFKSKS